MKCFVWYQDSLFVIQFGQCIDDMQVVGYYCDVIKV